jgi:hypothetical protein
MRWSITVGSVAGTAVRIHVTFLLQSAMPRRGRPLDEGKVGTGRGRSRRI